MNKKPTNPRNQYDRHSTVPLSTGIDAIREWMKRNDEVLSAPVMDRKELRAKHLGRVPINGIPVNMASLRLHTFATKGTVCIACGLKATHFAIERMAGDAGKPSDVKPYHLNLWGVDQKTRLEVLFTHDHTHQRSTGGKDDPSNTTTMCSACNNEKSKEEGRLALALKTFTIEIE